MANFDNNICYNNIITLYKQKGFKIGEFENKLGVAIGYFSRLIKEDGKMGMISSEILFKAAEVLNVPVEILGSTNLTELNPTEKYLFDFLNKLFRETEKNNISWKAYRADCLYQYNHISSLIICDNMEDWTYDSGFWDERLYNIDLFNDVFAFDAENGIFMLTNIKVIDKTGKWYIGYEFYYKDYNKTEKSDICHSEPSQNQCLNQALKLLFEAVSRFIKRPKIDNDVRLAIDSFMNKN